MTSPPSSSPDKPSLRLMIDLAVCFVITVCLLRTFFVEGYLVSTGSMAPGLLGFHKRIHCPSCEHSFAFGVRFDESTNSTAAAAADSALATCPNCGQININTAEVPVTHGDQLLVHRHAFDFRRPHRWEPVVFRNPAAPSQAYVKRVVGMPGEELQVRAGDVYINGQIARKDPATQQAMKIPVFDLSTIADDPDWELPWQLEGDWLADESGLKWGTSQQTRAPCRLLLRYWRWYGGRHVTEVALSPEHAYPDWTDFTRRFQRVPVSWASQLDYDEERQVLRCRGVMPVRLQKNLMESATQEEFRRAIYRLAALSHLSPVTDSYGYNSAVATQEFPVEDLWLECELDVIDTPKRIRWTIPVAGRVWELQLDPAMGAAQLTEADSEVVLRNAAWDSRKNRLKLAVSTFDHRILVLLNGEPLFRPLDLPAGGEATLPPGTDGQEVEIRIRAEETARILRHQHQWQIELDEGTGVVRQLKLYRDVFYTAGRGQHGITNPVRIPPDSYFVQGDNSPVSFDSRSWSQPFVKQHLLVGKPFVVHLPSRPGRLQIGSREISIRIPDFSRIRYIQ